MTKPAQTDDAKGYKYTMLLKAYIPDSESTPIPWIYSECEDWRYERGKKRKDKISRWKQKDVFKNDLKLATGQRSCFDNYDRNDEMEFILHKWNFFTMLFIPSPLEICTQLVNILPILLVMDVLTSRLSCWKCCFSRS